MHRSVRLRQGVLIKDFGVSYILKNMLPYNSLPGDYEAQSCTRHVPVVGYGVMVSDACRGAAHSSQRDTLWQVDTAKQTN